MSYGANEAVEDAEDQYKEECAQLVARVAAEQVASRGCGREEAIEKAIEWLRNEQSAEGDVTGSKGIEIASPAARKSAPGPQVAAIANELLEAARDAVDDL